MEGVESPQTGCMQADYENNLPASQSPSNPVTLQHLYDEIIDLKKVNIEVLNNVMLLQEENKALKHRITVLESKLNWVEQSKKQNVIEITGISTADHTNAFDLAQKVFSNCLNLKVESNAIQKCYVKKILNKNSNNSAQNSKKVICVHLTSNDMKQKILKIKSAEEVKKKLNTSTIGEKQNEMIYINHSLTKYTQALFMAAREVKRVHHYKFLWFNNSNIFLKKEENSRVMVIRSFDDLKKS